MHNDEMDRILSTESEIRPSPMFAAKVMQSVYREAATPPPIAFPWKRALPGMAASLLAVILCAIRGPVDIPTAWIQSASRHGVPWVLGALLVAWAALAASRRLASR